MNLAMIPPPGPVALAAGENYHPRGHQLCCTNPNQYRPREMVMA